MFLAQNVQYFLQSLYKHPAVLNIEAHRRSYQDDILVSPSNLNEDVFSFHPVHDLSGEISSRNSLLLVVDDLHGL